MKKTIILTGLVLLTASASAQVLRSSSSQFLSPSPTSDVYVPFLIGDEGVQLPVRWGMDVAWRSRQNMQKGINHIGKSNLSLVRSCFRTDARLQNDTSLTTTQMNVLRDRMNLANLLSADCDIILNSDQEAGVDSWYGTSGNSNVDHWVATISATIDQINKSYPRHKVLAVSPFNEPDYTSWKQGSKANMKEISRRLKERYPDLLITAGNTLNCDEAAGWYEAVKPYVDWGNTHQLAGSFDTYASFFKRVTTDGNYGYADELHNVGEAMVGAEYGMQAGIWWGFDSRARGEFCQISNHGSRIGYGENRSKWTSASVYRNDETGAVKAFVGSSERQANTSTFSFVSNDREVYFEGQGPQRVFQMEIPGGTGYQKGQTNAERVINIDYGEDVPPSAITAGTYKIMNIATRCVAALYGTSDGHPNISLMRYVGNKNQQWNIELVSPRIGGDYSFYKITNAQNGTYMNVLNNSLTTANVISYDAGCASNEQWYLEYVGNGCYYIRNRESGLYLSLAQKSTSNGTNIRQTTLGATDAARELQLWRILPLDADCETNAPEAPAGLQAESRAASVALHWTANNEDDLAGYMVLRQEKGTDDWNTIARKVTSTSYVDNTCRQGVEYEYKLKAIDFSENQSECSEAVTAQPSAAKGLIAHWDFDDDLLDATDNYFDAIHVATPSFVADHKSGSKSVSLNGATDYVQLPYEIADMDEMTISMWVYWTNPTSSWIRLFDFGNGTNHYMFLTPYSGSGMRFAIKNGGDEQQLNYRSRLGTRAWKHVALTIGSTVSLYIDGEQVATTTDITIRPSDIRPVQNFLGRSQFSSDPKFRGYLDDVRIYNYALSPDEVKAAMNEIADGISTVGATVPEAPAAYYQLDGVKTDRSRQRGIVIRQHADGQTEKIIVK